MKTALAVFVTALFLFTTPFLAAAHDGGQYKNGRQQFKRGWVKDQHQQRHAERRDHRWERKDRRWERKDRREQRHVERRDYRSAKQYRKAAKHSRAHAYPAPRHYRPAYGSAPSVVVRVPNLIFRIGW